MVRQKKNQTAVHSAVHKWFLFIFPYKKKSEFIFYCLPWLHVESTDTVIVSRFLLSNRRWHTEQL